MLKTVVIWIWLGAAAGNIALPNSTPPSPNATHLSAITTPTPTFDEDAELAKIATSCFSTTDYKQLSGNIVKGLPAQILGNVLLPETVKIIGLTELRATLNLAPLPPWKHYNGTYPSDSEIASAPTLQAYYDLIEPRSYMRSLDSDRLLESNVPPAIAYLDERIPSIRKIFRSRFEETRQSSVVIDRKTIDQMIHEFTETRKKVHKAVRKMTPGNDSKCYDDLIDEP